MRWLIIIACVGLISVFSIQPSGADRNNVQPTFEDKGIKISFRSVSVSDGILNIVMVAKNTSDQQARLSISYTEDLTYAFDDAGVVWYRMRETRSGVTGIPATGGSDVCDRGWPLRPGESRPILLKLASGIAVDPATPFAFGSQLHVCVNKQDRGLMVNIDNVTTGSW